MIAKNKSDIVNLRKIQSEKDFSEDGLSIRSITLNPSELCNRRCSFCPRYDVNIYPNRNLNMSYDVCERISDELNRLNYKYRIGWSGNGEPLLHNDIFSLIECISNKNPQIETHEINTNGDFLTEEKIDRLYKIGINNIIVSVYDGEKSLEKFLNLFKIYDEKNYTIRVSYDDGSVKEGFTNRSGLVKNVQMNELFKSNRCFIPFYKLFIDWNGDILLCCEDWLRKSKSNLNIMTKNLDEIWNSDHLNKYRNLLKNGKRIIDPCKNCNINGELVGENFLKL